MTTQTTMILDHMKRTGSITMREALLDYSIQSLTRRIADLRQAGYKILTERKFHPTTGQQYARYKLVSKKKH